MHKAPAGGPCDSLQRPYSGKWEDIDFTVDHLEPLAFHAVDVGFGPHGTLGGVCLAAWVVKVGADGQKIYKDLLVIGDALSGKPAAEQNKGSSTSSRNILLAFSQAVTTKYALSKQGHQLLHCAVYKKKQKAAVTWATEAKSNQVQATYLSQLEFKSCLLYTSPSPRDQRGSRMPSSA